jgi:uncharacterized protein (DUF2062 family)
VSDSLSPDSPAAAPTTPARNFWQRRVRDPIVAQLTQGITPEKIALTVAIGSGVALFPILGTTTLLCFLVALALRLNQPIIQGTGTLAYPLQLVLLLPFYRAGESLFSAPAIPLSIPQLLYRFFEDTPRFLQEYGMTGVRGIFVWSLLAPVGWAALYFSLRPLLRRWAARLAQD